MATSFCKKDIEAEQKSVMIHFIYGHDVFAILPTIFGKSSLKSSLQKTFTPLDASMHSNLFPFAVEISIPQATQIFFGSAYAVVPIAQ